MRRPSVRGCGLVLAACCVATPAVAQDGGVAASKAEVQAAATAPPGLRVPRPLWELGLGVAVASLPDYRGSDHSSTYLLPLPYLVYRGEWLKADREGARALLVRTERVKLDLSLAATVPARSRDNEARRGMPDLAPTVELGPNLDLALARAADGGARLDLRLPLRGAVTIERSPRFIGTTFSPNLNLDLRAHAGWRVGLLTGPLFADRRYHQHFYGVDPAYVTVQRPAYAARGGYAGWQALVAVSRRFGRTWVGAFARADDLHGAVFDDSPLVRRRESYAAGVGVSWIFATSGRLVAADD